MQNYDYSENGAYFITICVKDKKPCLGQIVDDDSYNKRFSKCFVGDGILDVPQNQRIIGMEKVKVKLSYIGEIVKETIEYINKHNKEIDVAKYVIMSNHIHLLISINADNGTSGKPSPTQNKINTRTNELIPKVISFLKRYTNRKCKFDIWQRSYIDHIIRNQRDYDEHLKYIDQNPLKWELDKYYIL